MGEYGTSGKIHTHSASYRVWSEDVQSFQIFLGKSEFVRKSLVNVTALLHKD